MKSNTRSNYPQSITLAPRDEIERRFVADGATIVTVTDRNTGNQYRAIDLTGVMESERGSRKACSTQNLHGK